MPDCMTESGYRVLWYLVHKEEEVKSSSSWTQLRTGRFMFDIEI